MYRCWLCFLLLWCLVSSDAFGMGNLLQNGSFSAVRNHLPVNWGVGPGGSLVACGTGGKQCLKIDSPIMQYTAAEQYLALDGSRVHKVRFSGSIRYENVRAGKGGQDRLRAFLVWFDKKGRHIGEFVNAGTWTGSSDWTTFNIEAPVPKETVRAEVVIGFVENSGTCYIADVSLTVIDGDTSFDPKAEGTTDRRGWWSFTAAESPAEGTAVDVSSFLDAPAGKHGFLKTKGSHFVFDDGTPARFWGFDIMGSECFPNHKTAERLAARLARMGANIVRLHHMDAPWARPNIFNNRFDDTQHLSAASLERLDYFLFQLKKRGIYVYLDWLVNRKFKAGDHVADWKLIDDGAKIVAHFNPRIIELQKKYMAQLLGHKNPYTGLFLRDEPQIVLSEVINEDSLFYEDWYYLVPPRYLNELRKLCRGIEPAADPGRHPFDAPTLRALYRIESEYYRSMRTYLKQIGLRCPTTGSNHWENLGPALLADSETDYIDRHYYWDHPKDGFGYIREFDNLSMLTHPDLSFVPDLAATRVAGKPFVVTEWCFCWINDFISEAPLMGAAYASLQDWNVMIWFDISATAPGNRMENEFDMANKPHLFAQWPAAALMFYRRDLKPLQQTVIGRITPDALLTGLSMSSSLNPADSLDKQVMVQIGKEFRPVAPPEDYPDNISTPGMIWDADAGTFTVSSAGTSAATGFLGGSGTFDMAGVQVRVQTPFCSIWLTALDSQPANASKHLLLTLTSHVENTGMTFNGARTHLTSPGHSPLLVEPVQAALTFPSEVTVYPLAQDGRRGSGFRTVTLQTGSHNTFWYEIVR